MAEKKPKKNGRIKQIFDVYRVTRQHDRGLPAAILLSFLVPVLAGLLTALLLPDPAWFKWVMWPLTGILVGLLIAMIVLGKRAEKSAYQQIEGKAGAVGAVIQSGLKRSWRGNETPVALNRHKDAVYRVIGKAGIVLICEGSKQRSTRMAQDESRKLKRAFKNVAITQLYVGSEDGIALHNLNRELSKLKTTLNRREVEAVYQRLLSLHAAPVGIPKGIDPNRVRTPAKPR